VDADVNNEPATASDEVLTDAVGHADRSSCAGCSTS
jgi:hypothetical protein